MMLWLHIGGGLLTFIAVLTTLIAVFRQRDATWIRRSLPSLALWQTATGTLLVMSGGSILRVCGMGIVYLSVVALVYLWAGRREYQYAYQET